MRTAPAPLAEDVATFPHNLEAERSVIGAVLINNAAFFTAARLVRWTDFFREAHRQIFQSLERILGQPGAVADRVTITDDLMRHDKLTTIGGPAYLVSLIDGVPKSTNVAHYAKIVKDRAILRSIITEGTKLVQDAYIGEDSPDDLLLRADKTFVELQYGQRLGRMQTLAGSSADLSEDMERRHANPGAITGVPTGFDSLDQLTLGWQPGEVIVVAARPSVGKTTLVVNGCALAAARAGKRTAVFSMEMRRRQLEYRLLSSMSGIPLTTLLSGATHSEKNWQALAAATAALPHLPIAIDDSANHSAWSIRAECRRLRAEQGLDMAIIDYVQLMKSSLDRRGTTRNDELTDTSRQIKGLADELGVPILVLSQLSRAGEGRADPRPKLSDLRESGALEQDADLVCFLHRKNHRESGVTQFIIEKQRNGPTGTLNLNLDRDTVTFTDAGEETPADREETKAAEQRQTRQTYAWGKARRG